LAFVTARVIIKNKVKNLNLIEIVEKYGQNKLKKKIYLVGYKSNINSILARPLHHHTFNFVY
jgi:hypothetical protein